MWVRSLGQEDPLEKGMATHSSILAWEIPWREEPGWLQSMGLQRVRHGLLSKQQQQEDFKRGDSSEVVCEALSGVRVGICRLVFFFFPKTKMA